MVGTLVWRMPLGGFVSDARLPALCEVLGGAEALVAGEVAMDPDFRLGALFPSPAFDMPFRTRTAFSSAWVRSSSSLRSCGLGMHAAKTKSHAEVPHHFMSEDRPEAAPGEGRWLRFTCRLGLFISFWRWGWLRSQGLGWFPVKTQGSRGTARAQQAPRAAWPRGRPAVSEPAQKAGSTDNPQLRSERPARGR